MLLLSSALGGCALGPHYEPPTAPEVARYTSAPLPQQLDAGGAGPAGGVQRFDSGAVVDARWWRQFGSTELDGLVDTALAHDNDIAAAQATLDQAREQLRAAQGALLPQVGVNLGAGRTRSSGAAAGGSFGPQAYNLFTGEVSVGYDPDVFGLNRAVVRNADAQADVAQDRLAAMRLAIAGNVVNTALNLAALREQVAATEQSAADEQRVLALTRRQYRLGAIDESAVLTQESLLASTQAQRTQLAQARDAAQHLLATYLGRFPSEADALAVPALGALTLPGVLPLTLPSTLVRERPDIRAAEAQLRAANAQVAVAVARLYPRVTLSADLGGQSNRLGDLFDPASRIWDLAAGVVAPVFEGGTLRAQKRAAEAAYRGVFATYRGTVLGAFREVADVLRALQHDAALLDAQAHAEKAARQALRLATTRYRAGEVDFLTVLTSETQLQAARVALVKVQAQRYADTAALYVALGGGDWAGAKATEKTDAAGLPEPVHAGAEKE